MDDVAKPVPINIDLADDHYDHKELLREPVHNGDDPEKDAAVPKAVGPHEE